VIPSVATALDTTAATPTTITTSFIGPANDQVTGTGTPSGYYLAYGTSANITEDNYFSQSFVTVTAVTPGFTCTKQLTSLANQTIYYFAVRAISQCGSLGAISAVQCGVTRKSNGTSSTQICRSTEP
jgi:hypothetical protein